MQKNSEKYKQDVLSCADATISFLRRITSGWQKYTEEMVNIGIDTFGESAPEMTLLIILV